MEDCEIFLWLFPDSTGQFYHDWLVLSQHKRVKSKLLGLAGERPDELHGKETYMAMHGGMMGYSIGKQDKPIIALHY